MRPPSRGEHLVDRLAKLGATPDGHGDMLTGHEPACACPRCDYDLSGETESWKRQCPLEGRCPECGLDIAWHDLLSPTHQRPKWSFEHAHTRRLRAFLGTIARSVMPWNLARSLKMHHEFRPVRLGVLVAGTVLVLYLSLVAFALPQVANDLLWAFSSQTPPPVDVLGLLRFTAWPISIDPYRPTRASNPVLFAPLPLIWGALVTILFAVIPITIRRHRVSPRHFVRMGAYCTVGVMSLAASEQLILALDGLHWTQYHFTGRHTAMMNWLPYAIVEWMQAATIVWMILFWWCAFRFYMRLPHALWMSILLNVIGAIGSTLIIVGFMDALL